MAKKGKNARARERRNHKLAQRRLEDSANVEYYKGKLADAQRSRNLLLVAQVTGEALRPRKLSDKNPYVRPRKGGRSSASNFGADDSF